MNKPMQIVDEYKHRVEQAATMSEKADIAAELHQLASTFDADQRNEYEEAMRQMRQTLDARIPLMDAAVEKAEHIMASIEARRTVRV